MGSIYCVVLTAVSYREEINRNITTISTIADTTLADASQTSLISEELVQLAAELNRLVSQFRL